MNKWETLIRFNHYVWCKENGRDTKWFETDKRKRQAGRPKRQANAQATSERASD